MRLLLLSVIFIALSCQDMQKEEENAGIVEVEAEVEVEVEVETAPTESESLASDEEEPQIDEAGLLLTEINAMVADRSCDSAASCKVTGIGSKICGGPAGYLVYSSKTTDETALLPKLALYAELSEQRNRDSGLMGDCSMVYVPTNDQTLCIDNKCATDLPTLPLIIPVDVRSTVR